MMLSPDGLPYLDAWLRRTRRQFAVSGRLAQTAWLLSQEDGCSAEVWCARLRDLMEGKERPSVEVLTRIDAIVSGKKPAEGSPPVQPSLW